MTTYGLLGVGRGLEDSPSRSQYENTDWCYAFNYVSGLHRVELVAYGKLPRQRENLLLVVVLLGGDFVVAPCPVTRNEPAEHEVHGDGNAQAPCAEKMQKRRLRGLALVGERGPVEPARDAAVERSEEHRLNSSHL